MEENNNVKPDQETPIDLRYVLKVVKTMAIFGFLGYLCHILFDWSTWWCVGIGLVIGWGAPGVLEGMKEGWTEFKEEENGKEERH